MLASVVSACARRPNALQNDRRRWSSSSWLASFRSSYSEKTPSVLRGDDISRQGAEEKTVPPKKKNTHIITPPAQQTGTGPA